MNEKRFIKNMIEFIEDSTCAITCIQKIQEKLQKKGYTDFTEQKKWKKTQRFFVTRNEGSIIAIEFPKQKSNAFLIITTHTDTPSIQLKPNGTYIKANYLKHNIMPYGGLLNYGWLDHPLALAGRIITQNKGKLSSTIIDTKKPTLIIPSVAIHQNDKANSNLDLNIQQDLQPILALSTKKEDFQKLLKKYTKDSIIDYDLYAYNCTKPSLIGLNDELLISPRIDNLTSVYTSLESFLNSDSDKIKVFCSFNHEEIGNLTLEGADSNFLLDTIKRVCALEDLDYVTSLSSSMMISSDNTHAIHPNHEEFADDTGAPELGKGFTLIRESTTTTNALSSSIVKTICQKKRIKYQNATTKNDLTGGSTLSSINLSHVSILSADIGIAQLAMHSSLETCSPNDILELYKFMKAFYETKMDIKKEKIIFSE